MIDYIAAEAIPVGFITPTAITGSMPPGLVNHDGYIRHFDVIVPPDAVAHIDPELGDAALKMMSRNMRAEIEPASECLR